jgi:hypothetical protein
VQLFLENIMCVRAFRNAFAFDLYAQVLSRFFFHLSDHPSFSTNNKRRPPTTKKVEEVISFFTTPNVDRGKTIQRPIAAFSYVSFNSDFFLHISFHQVSSTSLNIALYAHTAVVGLSLLVSLEHLKLFIIKSAALHRVISTRSLQCKASGTAAMNHSILNQFQFVLSQAEKREQKCASSALIHTRSGTHVRLLGFFRSLRLFV